MPASPAPGQASPRGDADVPEIPDRLIPGSASADRI